MSLYMKFENVVYKLWATEIYIHKKNTGRVAATELEVHSAWQ